MSKAVTNEEVEDVLSSIRRLVSEDKRPLAGLRAAQEPDPKREVAEPQPDQDLSSDDVKLREAESADPVGEAPAVDRLVLTPALRITDAPAEKPESAEEGPLDLGSVARRTWTPDEGGAGPAPDEATVEDAMAYKGPMVLFPAAQDDVPAGERDAAMAALDALVHDTVTSEFKSGTAYEDDDLADGDYGDEGYWDDDIEHAEPDYTLTGAVEVEVADGAAVEVDEASAEVDTSREDRGPDAEMQRADAKATDVQTESYEPDLRQSASVTQIPLTAKIAALEAAVGKITSGWEPDGDETEDLAVPDTPAMAWEDDVELDAKGIPFIRSGASKPDAADQDDIEETESAETASPTSTAAFGGDDQVMDEEALRDLVAEIVRSELQGALGERITRNVRKLVRREIHRALTAQEME
jgi:hypothetical protein